MPTELELCAVSAVIGALLGGAVAYTITHKIDGAELSHVKAAYADDIARINATSAKQLADALAKQQAAEGHVATLEQQYNTEVSQHAKDSLDYRAKLLAGTERVRVRVAGSNCTPGSKSTATPGATDDTAPTFYLPGATAASVIAVVDSADATAAQLRALQQYVKGLQDDGYISK